MILEESFRLCVCHMWGQISSFSIRKGFKPRVDKILYTTLSAQKPPFRRCFKNNMDWIRLVISLYDCKCKAVFSFSWERIMEFGIFFYLWLIPTWWSLVSWNQKMIELQWHPGSTIVVNRLNNKSESSQLVSHSSLWALRWTGWVTSLNPHS